MLGLAQHFSADQGQPERGGELDDQAVKPGKAAFDQRGHQFNRDVFIPEGNQHQPGKDRQGQQKLDHFRRAKDRRIEQIAPDDIDEG